MALAAQEHPPATDLAVALFVAAISCGWLLTVPERDDLVAWVFQVALLAPLVARRQRPVAVFVVLSAVASVQWLTGVRLVADLALLVVLYTLAAHRPRRVAMAAAGVVEVGVIMASLRWRFTGSWMQSLTFLTATAAGAVLLGTNLQARRANLALLTERAERSERERDQHARMAAASERSRIAREMHDTIAHSLAVMVALAEGALAKLVIDPHAAAAAIEDMSDLGRQALRETRQLLGVLRTEGTPGPTAPQPGLDQLNDLVAQVRATGLQATMAVSGNRFGVSPGAGLTVYRIVQEALTNSLKHATGAHSAHVRLYYREPALDVEVSDDGRASAPAGTGQGLSGMRERVSLYQGTVTAGPGPAGGWIVRASLDLGPGEPP